MTLPSWAISTFIAGFFGVLTLAGLSFRLLGRQLAKDFESLGKKVDRVQKKVEDVGEKVNDSIQASVQDGGALW